MTHPTQTRRGERGFTLVELAIVLVIIGLLIGGVLQGRQMIANAQLTRTAADIDAFDAAFSNFYDMFGGIPGDIANSTQRIPNCAAAPCLTPAAGAGNGRLEQAPGAVKPANSEAMAAWHQLSNVDLISADFQVGNGTNGYGAGLPKAPIGGGSIGFEVGSTVTGAASDFPGLISLAGGPTTMQVGQYLVIKGSAGAVVTAAPPAAALTPKEAEIIDRKRDDGSPASGSVRGFGGTGKANCATAAAAGSFYNSANSAPLCGIYVRMSS